MLPPSPGGKILFLGSGYRIPIQQSDVASDPRKKLANGSPHVRAVSTLRLPLIADANPWVKGAYS